MCSHIEVNKPCYFSHTTCARSDTFMYRKHRLFDTIMPFFLNKIKKNRAISGLYWKIQPIYCAFVFPIIYRPKINSYLQSQKTRKLQVGCGDKIKEGWLNTDRNPRRRAVFLDATKPFPLPDNSFDYVYAENLLEHLPYEDGVKFATECYRVLRKNGKLRVTTPDLNFLFQIFTRKAEIHEAYLKWAVESNSLPKQVNSSVFVINNFFRAWGHTFVYDFETLSSLLTKCGFRDVTRFDLGKSDDVNLQNIESHMAANQEFYRLESMFVEASVH